MTRQPPSAAPQTHPAASTPLAAHTNSWRLPLEAAGLLYYPFLAVLCGFALLLVLGFFALGVMFDGVAVIVFAVPAFILLVMVGHVLFSLRVLFGQPSLDDPHEVQIPPIWLDRLHQLAQHVARRHQLPPPDEVRLHVTTIAHVYEADGGRRVLVVGGAALATLTQPLLAAIVAHELGHLAAGDTELSRRGELTERLMRHLEVRFYFSTWSLINPMVWMIRAYHFLYRVVLAAHSRVGEYAADQRSVQHAGIENTARALLLVSAIDEMPWARLSSIAESCAALNLPMDRIFSEQARRAAQTTPADWETAVRKATDETTALLDSHPALKDRLKAIGVRKKSYAYALARTLNQEGSPARDLVAHWGSIEQVMTEYILGIVRENRHLRLEGMQVVLGRPL
ncbi:MAG: M48 family metalloprotease [Planctomycetaceae bacterium]